MRDSTSLHDESNESAEGRKVQAIEQGMKKQVGGLGKMQTRDSKHGVQNKEM
jgi:hypothetical protein